MFPSGNPFGGNVSNLFAAAAAVSVPSAVPAATLHAQSAATASDRSTELNSIAADQVGTSSVDPSNLTIATVSAGIAAVYNVLEEIPLNDKAAYVYARQSSPELVGEEEVLKFLLSTNFKVLVSRGVKLLSYFSLHPGNGKFSSGLVWLS